MGKALEEIEKVLTTIENRQEQGIYTDEMTKTLLMLQGQKAVIIALEDLSFTVKDIAKAIRER